ncbi:hypothetical protein MKX03_034250 [Papaver bracteatum]|nr:hypothetical protein MKX03_034250 [Papaver bracteatum]
MGSLMGGWDSLVRDLKSGNFISKLDRSFPSWFLLIIFFVAVTYQRNNSCTKEEIEAYWKSKEPVFEKENYTQRVIDQENTSKKQSGNVKKFQRFSSLPLIDRKGNILDVDETAIDKLIKTNNWWTRSNWAFLNEPPVIATTDHEGRAMYTYSSQYHVASDFGSLKQEDTRP